MVLFVELLVGEPFGRVLGSSSAGSDLDRSLLLGIRWALPGRKVARMEARVCVVGFVSG